MSEKKPKEQVDDLKQELSLLYKLDEIRDSSQTLDQLLERILELVIGVLDVEMGFALVYNDEMKVLDLVAANKKGEEAFGKSGYVIDAGMKALRKKEIVVQRSPKKAKNLLSIPLIINQRPLGAFVFLNKPTHFDDADLNNVKAIISQTDSAIDHARVFKTMKQRNKELTVLYKIDEIRDTVRDFDKMLNMVLEEIVTVIDAKIGFIVLFNDRKQELELKVINVGERSNFLKKNKKVIEKKSLETINKAKMLVLERVNKDIDSMLILPLVLNERIIGVFGVVNSLHGRFTNDDQRLMIAVGSQADTAIFEDLEKKKIKDVFKRYVAEDVVEEMLTKDDDWLSGRKIVMTVSFADMRGFTEYSEKTTPEDLMKTMDEYLGAMTDVVMDNRGTLDKFVGDEVMSLFGAPIYYKDHAKRAIKTAIDMQKKMKQLAKNWKHPRKKALGIGIGINTGPMVVGNIGCEKMSDYTVLGDSVNLGARLCGVAVKGQILVPESTYKQAKNDFKFRKLEPVSVKGKAKPITIYEVVY